MGTGSPEADSERQWMMNHLAVCADFVISALRIFDK
jgi:hypothetical protein